jgi:hypothetical protein
MIPATLDFADVVTEVGTLVASPYVLAALAAAAAIALAPRVFGIIKSATRGR